MISSERMRKLEVLVLARDVDAVLRYLGFAGCLQLIAEASQPRDLTPDERGIADLNAKVASLCRFLGVDTAPPAGSAPAVLDREKLTTRAQEMLDEAYQCPVDLVAHGIPHRVLGLHADQKEEP